MSRILALSPGARHFALVTLDGDAVVRAEVHSLRSHRDSVEKFRRFLDIFRVAVEEDAPDAIAVEALDARRANGMTNGQAMRALDEANARGIHGCTVAPARSDSALAERFPELRAAADALTSQGDPRRSRRLLAAAALGLAAARLLSTEGATASSDVCKPSDLPASTQE